MGERETKEFREQSDQRGTLRLIWARREPFRKLLTGGSLELPTAYNIKGHNAQSGDTIIGESQVESEGTNGFGWDGEVTPQML